MREHANSKFPDFRLRNRARHIVGKVRKAQFLRFLFSGQSEVV
jgi:hypothetical protein